MTSRSRLFYLIRGMKEWQRQIYSASYGDNTYLDSVSLVGGKKKKTLHFSEKKEKLGQCRNYSSNCYI